MITQTKFKLSKIELLWESPYYHRYRIWRRNCPPPLRKMKVILISYGVFKLATGDEIELPIFWGKISIQLIEKMKENLKLFRIFLLVSHQ
jgi:hypothetical protein